MTDGQAALSALASDPSAPAKLLIAGGIGVGKTTTLAAAREILRAAGVSVVSQPPEPGQQPTGAVIVDDVDQLSDAELATLTDIAADPTSTLIVAAAPREHNAALRTLMTAIERENPRSTLAAWSRTEVSRRLAGADPLTVDALISATAGLPFLVEAVRATNADGAIRAALVDRLRRFDQPAQETLLIMSLSPTLGPADVALALSIDLPTARALVDVSYATGLLNTLPDNDFAMTVHQALAILIGATRHREIESALLHTQYESSTLTTDLAINLAEHGFTDALLGEVLAQRAANLHSEPGAARLLRAAVDTSGGPHGGMNPLLIQLADATARIGDCAAATVLADELLGATDPARRAAAVRVAASVAAHDGKIGQAAELFSWLGPGSPDVFDEMICAAGTIVLVGNGDVTAARALVSVPSAGPPTSSARAARSLAEGILLTVDQPYAVAVSRLGQAIGQHTPTEVAMPDSASALLALAALHAGDSARAHSVIGRAAANRDPVFGNRHRLLRAWARMQDGHLAAAATDIATIDLTALHRRDALWAAALQTAIARRAGDTGALQRHWFAAVEILTEYSIDLFSLLPLGELWIAAARLRHADRLSHPLDQAFGLLATLGNPPSWSLPLHWAGVHAAILANSPGAVAPHGQALTAAAGVSSFADALAGAGRAWLRVLARQVDVDEVTAAARRLAEFGLTWDATRLAGQAALQAQDPRISGAMLQVARDLKLTDAGADEYLAPEAGPGDQRRDSADSAGPPATGASASGRSVLSEREREVAELLLLGMPYRDIGAALFISAKTVEHHVARIRRRLGAESRSDMLSMLRMMVSPPA